jgi:hypothetical protein
MRNLPAYHIASIVTKWPSSVFFFWNIHVCCGSSKVTYCTSKGWHGRTQTMCCRAGTRRLSIPAPGFISPATTITLSSVCMFLCSLHPLISNFRLCINISINQIFSSIFQWTNSVFLSQEINISISISQISAK